MDKTSINDENLTVNDEGFAYFYNLYLDAVKNLEYMCIYDMSELQKMRDIETKREKIEKVLSKVRLNNQEYNFDPVKFDIMLFVARRMGVERFTKNEFEDIDCDIIQRWYEKFFKGNVERYLNYKRFLGDKKYTRNEKIGLSNLKNAIIGRYGCIVLPAQNFQTN